MSYFHEDGDHQIGDADPRHLPHPHAYAASQAQSQAPLDAEKKRSYENSENNNQKRHRSEATGVEHPGEIVSRLLLSRTEFAKVIGKGGVTIASIRSKCGSNISGNDVSDDQRLVSISGAMRQVVDSFDFVMDLLYGHPAPGQSDTITVNMLIEHGKAGRVVGPKAATIQGIRSRSGVTQIRVLKEPQTIQGIQVRGLVMDGNVNSVRRAHAMVLAEIFQDNSIQDRQGTTPSFGSPYQGHDNYSSANVVGSSSNLSRGSHYGHSSVHHSTPVSSVLPIPSLQTYGIHPEVVRQLRDLQAYFVQFGMDIQIIDTRAHVASAQQALNSFSFNSNSDQRYSSGHYNNDGNRGEKRDYRDRDRERERDPRDLRDQTEVGNKLEFFIAKEKAGVVIGKGGQTLKEVQAEFNCKIRLDREELNGMRRVTVRHDDDMVMLRAKERILEIIANSQPLDPSHDEKDDLTHL